MLLKSAMSLAAFMVLVLSLPASTLAADGDLDPTFGTGGLVNTDFATSFDEARGLAIQADGKIVTAGLVFVGAPGDFGLARYLSGAAICGNGNVEPGETCDDGNNANGDGCSPACLVEPGFTCSGEPSSCTLLIAQCQLAKLTADDATSCDRCGDAFGISVSMTPGQLFMTILIPYHAEDLAGSEPLSVDLTYYNRSTGSWELAVGGNEQPSPDHGLDLIGDRFTVVDSTMPMLSDELGDYGVFWNSDLGEGFVWANVDYTAEFASARQPQAGAIPTVSEWGLVALILLMLTGIAIKFGRRRGREDACVAVGTTGYELNPRRDSMTWSKSALTISVMAGSVFLVAGGDPTLGQCELQKLTAGNPNPDGGDLFGFSVSMSGDHIVVGTPQRTGGALTGLEGKAFVFKREGTNWVEQAELNASDREPDDLFGRWVSISGDRIIVGAMHDDDACPSISGCNSGSAYIFEKPPGGWDSVPTPLHETAKLTASDEAANDIFGVSVSISGDFAVVGALGNDDACPNDNTCRSGSAYVFRRNGTTWVEDAKLTASDADFGHWFGNAVFIDGDYVLVGAVHRLSTDADDTGAAYIFRRNDHGTPLDPSDDSWDEVAILTASDGDLRDEFGGDVFISPDLAVVGAPDWEPGVDPGGCNSGAVYVFEKPMGGWVNMAAETARLTPSDPNCVDLFGFSLSASGDRIVVGAFGNDEVGENAGAVYLFDKPMGGWTSTDQETDKLTAGDGQPCDSFGGVTHAVSSSGNFIVVGANRDDDACPQDDACTGEPGFCATCCDSGAAYVFAVRGDCNNNGTPDACDIFDGTSQDVDGDGVPDECEEFGCGTLLVQVNEHTVGGGQGSTIVGIEELQLCVFDKSTGSCARNIGISRRHYPEIFTTCQPVVCETTDADGAASIILDAGDYVLIGEYDPDGFPPNDDGNERFIGVSASDFQCAADGDPNTVTMRKHLQVIILPNGRTVRVDPHGGSRGRSTENEWVEITNVAGPDDSISVTAVDEDLHAAAGPYKAVGTAIGIDSSLSPGQLFMTILIPYQAEDLAGSEPLSVDLTYYNRSTGSWELAVGGNDQPSPDHGLDVIGDRFAVVDSTIPVLSDELGDYGVFWNPDLGEGFVWANVDYTGEFASARQPQAGAIPTVSEWGLVALILLMLTGIAIKFGRRRAAA